MLPPPPPNFQPSHNHAPSPARLDHVVDARGLTDKLLEVLPVCPEEVKRDAITFLPEVATEDDHEVCAVVVRMGVCCCACWMCGLDMPSLEGS